MFNVLVTDATEKSLGQSTLVPADPQRVRRRENVKPFWIAGLQNHLRMRQEPLGLLFVSTLLESFSQLLHPDLGNSEVRSSSRQSSATAIQVPPSPYPANKRPTLQETHKTMTFAKTTLEVPDLNHLMNGETSKHTVLLSLHSSFTLASSRIQQNISFALHISIPIQQAISHSYPTFTTCIHFSAHPGSLNPIKIWRSERNKNCTNSPIAYAQKQFLTHTVL